VIIRGDLLRTLPTGATSGSAGPVGGATAGTANSGPGPGSSPGSAGPSNVAVAIGRYCFLSRGACLRPPGKLYKGYTYFPFPILPSLSFPPTHKVENDKASRRKKERKRREIS
jgi:hypothetical protein